MATMQGMYVIQTEMDFGNKKKQPNA